MNSVQEAWARIEAWLGAHAPQVLARLPGPASEEQIAQFEALIGVRLPEDARQSFALHDGSSGFGLVDGNELLSLERSAGDWEFWVGFVHGGEADDFVAEPGAGVGESWFRVGWIPLTYRWRGRPRLP